MSKCSQGEIFTKRVMRDSQRYWLRFFVGNLESEVLDGCCRLFCFDKRGGIVISHALTRP